ncbi:transposase, partial [Desulforhopalus sp. IMCC35007]
MAAIVYQKNKKTGVTYAYESISFWDKDKQHSRAKRKCIGRVDPETQKIVPTRKRKAAEVVAKAKPGPVPITRQARSFYGATYLFDQLGEEVGVTEDL